MDITLTMLLDLAFPAEVGKVSSAQVSLPVRGVRIWNDNREAEGRGDLEAEDRRDRDLLFIRKQKSGVLFLCGGEKIPFETDLVFAEVFNKLEEAFTALRDWDMQLHQGIIENKGFQYMLDVSENIFRCPVAITDSGYKRIAQTSRYRDGDPIFHDLREKGYLSADAISKLDKAGFIFEKKDIVRREGIEGVSFPMLNGTVFAEHDYRYMVTLLLPGGDYSEGIFELFSFFLGQLTLYVEKNGDAKRFLHLAWTSLLTDLADGKCKPEEFTERNEYSGLPEGRPYRLVSVRREDGTMREFMLERLERSMPGRFVFIYKESVLVLITDPDSPVIAPPTEMPPAETKETIAENHFCVSVSNRFETLLDLRRAYEQTNAAYTLGRRISQNRTLEKLGIEEKDYDTNIFRYSDYYSYDMIAGSPCLFPGFKALLAEDHNTKAGDLRLLYVYLKNDCSKTRTAAELFMHRNNVIYRISKLEETLGLSLSDEKVKTAFRLSFLALELLKKEELVYI